MSFTRDLSLQLFPPPLRPRRVRAITFRGAFGVDVRVGLSQSAVAKTTHTFSDS